MKHARADYARFQDPEGKIPDDEPVFLLRGQDAAAPFVVEYWVSIASALGADGEILTAAKEQAKLMREWQQVHGKKAPDMPASCSGMGEGGSS